MGPELLLDVILMKCESRAQQIGLAIGMALLIVACVVIGLWSLNLGQATLADAREMNLLESRRDLGLRNVMFYFYAGSVICGFLALLFSLIGVVNLVRFITRTGLKGSDTR